VTGPHSAHLSGGERAWRPVQAITRRIAVEKWQEENEKLLAIKNKVLDSDREATLDEMAEILLQIYNSAAALDLKITPLMFSTLAEIQYAIRSESSKDDHDIRVNHEIDHLAAYIILKDHDIRPDAGRVEKLTALLNELGHDNIKIETVAHGGNDHRYSNSDTARKLGSMRSGSSSLEIWAVWN
jgi:hypothetical protein